MDLAEWADKALANHREVNKKGGRIVLNMITLLGNIYALVDAVEDGEELHFRKKFGSVSLEVNLVKTEKVEEDDINFFHTDGRKITRAVIDALMAGFSGTDIKQDFIIQVDKDDPPEYMKLSLIVDLPNSDVSSVH